MPKRPTKPKTVAVKPNAYEGVTLKIIEQLEAGVRPWLMPWKGRKLLPHPSRSRAFFMSQPVAHHDQTEAVIASFGGDPRAAVAALIAENERLCRYVEQSVSYGYSRGGRAHVRRINP